MLFAKGAVALCIPSILIFGGDKSPSCILNLVHPEFGKVKLSGPAIVPVDTRLG